MSLPLFDVYLTGAIQSGQPRQMVVEELARLTRLPPEKINRMLAQQPVRMKAGIDQATAAKYVAALQATGALAEVRPQLPAPPPETAVDHSVANTQPVVTLQPALQQAQQPPQQALQQTPQQTPARSAGRRKILIVAVVLLALTGAVIALLFGRGASIEQDMLTVGDALNQTRPYQQQVEHYWQREGAAPSGNQDLELQQPVVMDGLATLEIRDQGRIIIRFTGSLEGATLELVPAPGERGIEWDCSGGSLPRQLRPEECQ